MKKFSAGIILFFVCAGFILGNVRVALAQDPVIDTSYYNDYEDRLQDCSLLSGGQGFAACFVNLAYYVVLTPSGWLASLTGEIFDYFIQYSLDSNSYKGNGDFIERGWSIVRDIGNVLFIFALLYIAISHILQAGTSGTKKLLASLIIAALMINFSLFFSRVIIDAGNILARAFYNNIEIENDDNLSYKTISQGIVAHVNPQRILSTDVFNPKYNTDPETPPGKVNNGYAFTIIMMAAVVNIILCITFISVSLLFVGRVVGLWFLMIFSPLALASTAVPNSGKIFKGFSWSGWLDQILSLSFMAPVFLFFLFLLIMFLQVIFQTNIPPENQSTIQKLMTVIIPFALVIFILNKAKSVAKDMAGEAGEAVKGVVGKVANFGLGAAGLVGGAALGVTAFAGRNLIGGNASEVLKSNYFQNRVRTNMLRATTSERKAKEATSEEEKKQHLKDAASARSAATRNAIMVRQLSGLKKSSFDVRRSDLLQKQIIGSSAGKEIGKQFSNLTKEFSGEKLSVGFGKGSGMTYAKAESEDAKKTKKDRLETGQLYDKKAVEDPSNQTLKDIQKAADKGLANIDEVLQNIDKYMQQITESEFLTDKEKEEKMKNAELWKNIAKDAIDDGGMKTVNVGTGTIKFINDKGEEDLKTVNFNIPDNSKIEGFSEKQGYAGQTETANLGGIRPSGLSKKSKEELIESLRKGDKPKDDKDELLAKVAKYAKDDDGHGDKDKKKDGHDKEHKEEKPEAPKPAAPTPSAPSGGGGGGGGGAAHH